MNKKTGAVLLCLMLCFAAALAGAEESRPAVDEAYRMMAGRISFTFPSAPSLVRENDRTIEESLERGGPYAAWTDKIQLAGETESGAEFRVHILNAEPLLDWMKENHPDEKEEQYPFHALLNLARHFADCLDAAIPDAPQMGYTGPKDAPLPVIMFSYRTTRSAAWHYGKAMMDGNTAVFMMGRDDPEVLAAIKDMRAVDQAARDAYDAREAQTLDIMKMQVTFPVPPVKENTVAHIAHHVLCPDGTMLEAGFLNMPLWMLEDGEDISREIKKFAQNTADGYKERNVIADYELIRVSDGLYGFSAKCQITQMINGMVPVPELMRCYISEDGIYTVKATDTEIGRAFLESIVFTVEEGEQ
ncbi:MAG: hypothetical protein IKH30_02020 [Clostridia bacterium]|nr:hypothetical protein [Clostridia bacterium]